MGWNSLPSVIHQASIPSSLTWEPKLNHHRRGWYPGRSEPDISAIVALLCIGGWVTASLASSHWLSVVTTENTDRLLSLREVNPYSPCQPLLCSVQNFLSTSKACISTLNVATSKIEFIVLENLKLTGKVSAVCCWARMVWRLWGKGGGEGREGKGCESAKAESRGSLELCCFVCFAMRRSQKDLWRCSTWEWVCMSCLLAWPLSFLVSNQPACQCSSEKSAFGC